RLAAEKVHLREELPFQFNLFRHGLDDQVSTTGHLLQIDRRLKSLHRGAHGWFSELPPFHTLEQKAFDRGPGSVEKRLLDVVHHRFVSGEGPKVGDSPSHRAGTQYRDMP